MPNVYRCWLSSPSIGLSDERRACPLLTTILVYILAFSLSGCGVLVLNRANAGSLLPQPSSVNFGAVSIGQTASTTVSLLNESSAAVEVTQLNLTGQRFSVVGPSSLPVTIAVGGTYTLSVQFNPEAVGTATGQLTIATSTSGTPVISLSGTGTSGTDSAALNALSCSSGAITGSGTDACTVGLTASAPSGGLIVDLLSSNAAVTVPSTVTVPAGAASAGFTASAAPVSTAQTATMTASAGGVFKNFTMQLNAAILALSINATNVAFGDVVVNTSATQPVTLTSTGILPVTVNVATLTGAGFTLPGAALPATLSLGQEATLNIEFDPAAVGTAAGQLVIDSNSSTDGTAVISLSGTGTPPAVAIAISPASVSTPVGAAQQFAASVTGTSNTAVIWTVSGTGCSGATCGTISSTGLYTAPSAIPSPATVTIMANSVSDPTKSASATVAIVQPAGATYYLAPAANGGNDSNSGLSVRSPWLTPDHAVNCGDVIIAAPSAAYAYANFQTFGSVTCSAGNNIAWLECAIFDGCKIRLSGSSTIGIWIGTSYWGVQGWEIDGASVSTGSCIYVQPYGSANIHNIIVANNILSRCGLSGFSSAVNGKHGVDYLSVVGNVAYANSGGSVNCSSGFSVYEPVESDSLPGTHIYVSGNFAYLNVNGNPCGGGAPIDGEGLIFDTFDGSQTGLPTPYAAQAVADNNIFVANGGRGLIAVGNKTGSGPFSHIYLRRNTLWGNNTDLNQTGTYCGELLISAAQNVEAQLNLAQTTSSTGCGSNLLYVYYVGASYSTVNLSNNLGYSASGQNIGTNNNTGFTSGPNNTFSNPQFANPGAPGVPSCGNFSSVPACMATVIANFTPKNPAAAGYGYQIPSGTPDYDPLFPQWLCNVDLPAGLISMGCKTSP